jgi:Transglycosylase SLT domain
MARFLASLRAALVCGSCLWASPQVASAQPADVLAVIDGAARRWGLTPRFMRCLASRESAYRPHATSRAGGMGLYQFTARTWRAHAPRYGWRGHSPYEAKGRGPRGGRDDRPRHDQTLATGEQVRLAAGLTEQHAAAPE